MGMVFGIMRVETPKFQVLHSTPTYEIRQYPPSVAAEITYDPTDLKGNKDGGFTILANYIGVLGTPQNTKSEKIAMTTPVLTKSTPKKIDMTTPVLTTKGNDGGSRVITMQFILPAKFKKAEEVPTPVDERMVIREEGKRKYGVVTFSGVATEKVVGEEADKLNKDLERDGFKVTGEYVLGRYNPPWITLPPFRTNEVMIPVE